MDPRQLKIERDLAPLLEGEVRTDPIALALFSTAACIFRRKPLAVVSPKSEADVAKTVALAAASGIPVTPRGGGSSLAGQALGPGIILDFPAHMNRILALDRERRLVRVEPGALHGRVQKAARREGLRLGPDPSSGDFCTIGGNVGTNASGAHTLRHGATKDHVLGLTVVLHDGTVVELGSHAGGGEAGSSWHAGSGVARDGGPMWRVLSAQVESILRSGAPAFLPERPRSNKNSCGYDLWGAWAPGDAVSSIEPRFDPMRLIVGSEGTLGVVTEVTMRLVEKPASTAVALLYFASWEDATEAVLEARRLGASAIEAMDHTFLAFVRSDREDLRPLIPERFDSSILVEFEGASAEEARGGIAAMEEWAAARRGKVLDFRAARNAAEQATLWNVRKAALPLIYRASPVEKPMNFIDDTAVPAERLGDYVNGLRAMFAKHRTRFAIFGHAGNGNVHVMPLMDPHDATFQSRMAAMAEDAFELTWRLGGTITGEHGDGILRAPYLARQYPNAYPVMARVKDAMDPAGILNPGNVISDARTFPEEYSRYTNTYVATGTVFDEPDFRDMIEMCHGCGTCRDYCPVGSTTSLEPHTARAKAVLLMEMIRGELSVGALTEKPLKEVMDSCFNCKLCLSECPSQVDIPGLAIAARKEFVEKHGMPIRNWVLGHADQVARIAGIAPAVVNLAVGNPVERAAREKVGKVAGRLDLPRFRRPFGTGDAGSKRALALPLTQAASHGPRGAGAHAHARLGPLPHRDVPITKRVAYFAGCFARFHDPQGEAEATVKVLEANGIEVVVPEQRCCGIALITMGAERSIVADVRRNLEVLLPLVDRGFTVVASAPSCGLALIEDYPRILGSEEARHLAAHTIDIHQYLWRLHERGELRTDFKPVPISVVYHNACHSVAQGIAEEPIRLLKLVPGVEVRPIDDSCCGIAGTYGMKSENYDRAMEIGTPLFKELDRTKAEAILTGCGTCNIQIAHGAKREVVHTMAILRRAYGV
ncbi:MAG: anaerobic glycerol-3-phosphate dehydrogenase subunit C [Candidatus Eisenbacteria bacterium]|uniref:Anaerobic glycerol-3-phosphate dehydrogenase subunit C n=1 Tax=Eiseniibacteriota bacterium TaxID=2212470 RepID=A0A538TAH7_UNCEI|nr:MAG: anaerobic glycerol-3-phosphate dehydrogenase subunit C [Candidatus Eisenbacteria bacterium]